MKKIENRQEFLNVYRDFDDWLESLGFRHGHYWTESATYLDCNYWKDIDSLRSVEHYVNDTLQLSLRFLRYRDEHSFHIVCGPMALGIKMTLNEMKLFVLSECKNLKNEKLKALKNLNC